MFIAERQDSYGGKFKEKNVFKAAPYASCAKGKKKALNIYS